MWLALRFACIFGQPRRPDHRHRADRRAVGPHGSTLRLAQNRPRHGVRGLKRLVGFSAKNRFYRANRDLGRIFKTEFILQYPLGAGTAPPDPARLAQGRATPRNLVLRVWLTSRSICIGANRRYIFNRQKAATRPILGHYNYFLACFNALKQFALHSLLLPERISCRIGRYIGVNSPVQRLSARTGEFFFEIAFPAAS